MFCPNCGKKIDDAAGFCTFCGSAVTSQVDPGENQPRNVSEEASEIIFRQADQPAEEPKRKRRPTAKKMMEQGTNISPNMVFCQDGKYRWIYELNLLKNPHIFFLIWKIFSLILVGIFAVTMLIDVFSGDMDGERFLDTLKIFAYFLIGSTVLCVLGYLVYAAIMGGKYCVMFEMDEKGVNHKQLPKQLKKAQAISAITALAGAMTGNMTTVGVGLTSASRTEMYSEFSQVRKVKAYRKRDLIKVNERLGHNQVYAAPEDFDFVYNYIMAHVDIKP